MMAELTPPRWHPIGTHPRHEDVVLLRMADGCRTLGWWEPSGAYFEHARGRWVDGVWQAETPTHWCPIPPEEIDT